jgi:uncharacterized membrane protein YjgN (DUF898 family)
MSQEIAEIQGPAPPREYQLSFSGTASEYFRIWIVNLALSIATLGIYSAWAKVRRKRYFYSQTSLDGEPFEYTGQPVAILKGRVLAVIVAAAAYAASHYSWKLLVVMLAVAVFVFPWLVVRSYAFNAYNTTYRGLRFRFSATYWRCWRLTTGYGLLTIVTFGLGWFYFKTRLTEFVVRNHAYGATPFTVPDLKKIFFGYYGKMVGLGILGGIVLSATVFSIVSQVGQPRHDSPWAYVINSLSYVMYLGIFAYIRSRILNATYNNMELGDVRFRSTLGGWKLYGLYAVNILAIIFTLGLATPWAVIRTLRYRAECMTVVAPMGFDHFEAAPATNVAAAGEEVGEMLDVDFSL